jgi:hypothetical protein
MWKSLLLLTLSCLPRIVVAGPGGCPEVGQKPGQYSQLSVDLCYQDSSKRLRQLKIASPDRSIMLTVDGESGKFYQNGQALGVPFAVPFEEEWIWSPDSRAVIVTTFLGNASPEIAGVSFVDGVPIVRDDLMVSIQKDFAARHPGLPCSSEPNVAGLIWIGTTKAVLVAEIQPLHCENADGYFEGYVASIPDSKILQTYSMEETIKLFRKVLGPRLLGDIKLQKEEHQRLASAR